MACLPSGRGLLFHIQLFNPSSFLSLSRVELSPCSLLILFSNNLSCSLVITCIMTPPSASAPTEPVTQNSKLLKLPTEVTIRCLPFVSAADALQFAQTSKESFAIFNDERHFAAAFRRDFPKAAASTSASVLNSSKELYYLHLSIVAGYNPRWYRLTTTGNENSQNRQGFGKTRLLGHPIIYGGWACDDRGSVTVDSDVVYLVSSPSSSSSGRLEHSWKKLLNIGNDRVRPQYGTYCTAACGVDDVGVDQLRNISGFVELAESRDWDISHGTSFPVLFVSAGVVEGAYRGAFSFLRAIVGGTKKQEGNNDEASSTKSATRNKTPSSTQDHLENYDWCWLALSDGTMGELTEEAVGLARARESIPDCIPTGAQDKDTVTASATKFGGSARACHSLWYDRSLGCIMMFGGFTDTIARKACCPEGYFDENSDRIGNPVGNLQEMGWSGHRALHHLEGFDLKRGQWARILQSGANPIARFGCTVTDITDSSARQVDTNKQKSEYVIMGGCTGRHNHKGGVADGTELQDPASHRLLTLHRASGSDNEIRAQWRIPLESDRAKLTVDSAHCTATLGRLHASCEISERGNIFYGGGNPSRLSSSIMLLKHGIKDAWSRNGAKCRWENWGRPLSSYHIVDGNYFDSPDQAEWHFSKGKGERGGIRMVPSPRLPRGDALLVADMSRPGEAFLWGGWRGDELGDCWKLVIGIPRPDEGVVYGNQSQSIRNRPQANRR